MTDPETVARKLATIETHLRELRELARLDRLESDIKEQRFVTATLQLLLQNVIDVASHVVADDRLGTPKSQRHTFQVLAQAHRLDEDLARNLGRMAGFRNLLVYQYAALDLDRVRAVVEEHLDDLDRFVEAIRARLA